MMTVSLWDDFIAEAMTGCSVIGILFLTGISVILQLP